MSAFFLPLKVVDSPSELPVFAECGLPPGADRHIRLELGYELKSPRFVSGAMTIPPGLLLDDCLGELVKAVTRRMIELLDFEETYPGVDAVLRRVCRREVGVITVHLEYSDKRGCLVTEELRDVHPRIGMSVATDLCEACFAAALKILRSPLEDGVAE